MKTKEKKEKRTRRHRRVRAKIFGTAQRPRLCVFRSNKHIYAQLINDEKGHVLVAASDLELKAEEKGSKEMKKQKNEKGEKQKEERRGKVKIAFEVGKLIAEKALKKKIKKIVFDRGGYRYHGRVKALAEGAKEGGLKF